MNPNRTDPPPADLAHLTPQQWRAVQGYHCTEPMCRSVPGVMCRRNRGLYVQWGRTLKIPHPSRVQAERRGYQEELYLVTQMELILRELGQPVSRHRLFTVLEILRNVRTRPGW